MMRLPFYRLVYHHGQGSFEEKVYWALLAVPAHEHLGSQQAGMTLEEYLRAYI